MRFLFTRLIGTLLLSSALAGPAFAQARVDQLSGAAAISGTDTTSVCQGCGASTDIKKGTFAQILTYIQTNILVPISNVSGLGTGVAACLATPTACIPATWLQNGAAITNIGFTPVTNARTVTGTGMLAGGGDLTANRAITLAPTPANTIVANATGSSAVPTQVPVGTCLDMTSGTLSLTSVTVDKTGSGQAIVAGDACKTVLVGAFTYTLAQAGTTGFGPDWGACLLNTSAGNATVNATTSVFGGAGGTTSLVLRPKAWACPTSDGSNYQTLLGSIDGGALVVGGNVTGTVTPNANNVTDWTYTLIGPITLANPTNVRPGQTLNFELTQDVTGGRTIALGNAFKFPGPTAPMWSTAAGAIDQVRCRSVTTARFSCDALINVQ